MGVTAWYRDEPLLVAVTARKVCRPIGSDAIRHQWFDQCSFSTGRSIDKLKKTSHKKVSKSEELTLCQKISTTKLLFNVLARMSSRCSWLFWKSNMLPLRGCIRSSRKTLTLGGSSVLMMEVTIPVAQLLKKINKCYELPKAIHVQFIFKFGYSKQQEFA